MICSYINDKKYGLINLHSEQVYTFISESASNSVKSNQSNEDKYDELQYPPAYLNPAIYTNILTISTITKLFDFIKNLNEYPELFILDFNRIRYIQKNLKQYFNDVKTHLVQKNSKLLFINFEIDLEINFEENDDNSLQYLKKFIILTEDNSRTILNGIEFQSFRGECQCILDKKKHDRLIKSFTEQDPPNLHESSSVYLSAYFDFKSFIALDNFVYFCLYELALKMIDRNEFHDWEIIPSTKITLFCQTLNGAFIGSILGDLLGTDLFMIDHLGPINKIYNHKLLSKIDETARYIVVSDVLCLGTEVKNSKSIIEFSGANYLGNVSFLRIESRFEKDIDFKDIEFFYRITKNYNPINYSISTALDKKNE